MKLDRTTCKQADYSSKKLLFVRFSNSEVLFNTAASQSLNIRGDRVAFEIDGGELYMMYDLRKGFMVSSKGDGRLVIYCRELSQKIQEIYGSPSVKFEICEFKGGRWPLKRIDHQAKYSGPERTEGVIKITGI